MKTGEWIAFGMLVGMVVCHSAIWFCIWREHRMAVATAQLAGNNTYALKCPDCGDYYVQKVFSGYQCTKGHVWEHPDINAVACNKLMYQATRDQEEFGIRKGDVCELVERDGTEGIYKGPSHWKVRNTSRPGFITVHDESGWFKKIEPEKCCQKKDEVIRGLAERTAAQSELLSKRAEACSDCKVKDDTIMSLSDKLKICSEALGRKAEKDGFVGDPRFHAILKEMGDLHDERQQGYGTKNDPLANVRASEAWGIPAWMGAMIRGCDKIRRLQTYAETGHLNGEKVEDAFLDLANYAVIALVLWREQNEDKPCTT